MGMLNGFLYELSSPFQPLANGEMRAQDVAQNLRDQGIIDHDLEDYSDDDGHDQLEPIVVNGNSIPELKIYVGLLAPISNTYLTVVECLNGLLGNNCIVETEFYKICIKQLKENYRSGLNKFGKSHLFSKAVGWINNTKFPYHFQAKVSL